MLTYLSIEPNDATPAVASEIRAIEEQANGGFLIPYESDEEVLEDLRMGFALMARRGDDALGVVVVTQKPGGMTAEIELLAVAKAYQHRGIGKTLLKEALARLALVPDVVLMTRPGNPAIALYQKDDIGFVEQSREEDPFGDGKERIIMSWRGPRRSSLS